MKKNYLLHTFIFFLNLFTMAPSFAASKLSLTSSEEILFVSKDEIALIDINKTKRFLRHFESPGSDGHQSRR